MSKAFRLRVFATHLKFSASPLPRAQPLAFGLPLMLITSGTARNKKGVNAMPTRVLIADPDESLLAVYRDFLSRNGFDVVTATDGLTCLDALRRVEPDVLVLELDMPWGGGTGVLEVMHESSDVPLVPVLALTSRRDPDSFEEATAFKMLSRYHVKPLASDQLAKLIRTIQEESLFPEERRPAVLAEAGRRAKRRTHVRTRHALLSTIVRPRSPRSPEQPAAALSGS